MPQPTLPTELLAALAAVATASAAAQDPLDALRVALAQLVERLGVAGARLLEPDGQGGTREVAWHGASFPLAQSEPPAAPGLVAYPLRLAALEVGCFELLSPPAWLLEGEPAPLALLAAQVAPLLALRAESATRAREAARVQSLLEAGRATVSSLALKEVLSRAMQAVRDLFEASGVAIWRLDEGGVIRRFGSLGLHEEYVKAVMSLPPGEGVLGLALRQGRPIVVQDLARDRRVRMRAQLEREGFRSLVSVPLLCRGRAIGALSVYYRAPRSFTSADEESLAGLANQVAAAIDNALLHATTERALAEASAQRELLESVVRHAQDGILALDRGGRIVLFSPGCERLTGWPAEAALGRPLEDILNCGCCTPSPLVVPAGYAEAHVRTATGELRWLGVSTARISSRRPRTARTVAVLRDVTEAHQLDELKTAILSTASHELRTPLTGIRALSELLAEHEHASPDARQMAVTINRESERLTRLVENIMDVARIQAGRMPCVPRPVMLAPLLHDARTVLEGARRGQSLDVCVAGDLPVVWADPDRLRQVLDNLVDNAAKYSPAGSRVTLRAERLADAPFSGPEGGHGERGEMVLVSVLDQGPGIPPSQLERVFERFHRLSDTPGGSGLGLYLCRGLVELMGGRLWAESPPGGGACFRFTLPAAPRPATKAALVGAR